VTVPFEPGSALWRGLPGGWEPPGITGGTATLTTAGFS